MLDLALHLDERIARREHVGVQMGAAVCRISGVADLACALEGAANEVAARLQVSRPGKDETSEDHIGPGLKAPQSALFDQVRAEPTEAKCGLVVAEERTGDRAKPDIGGARTIAIAVFEAEIDHPAHGQGKEVPIRE